ncbi:MAG TPA: C40 family peptidase [Burkholderiales bacterium]|nr:C40 family peptidase [Burkholderiales bacterium]
MLVLLLAGGCAVQPLPQGGVTERADAPRTEQTVTPTAQEVVLHALALIGVPYRYGGSSPDTGLDCSGLVRHVVAKAAGLKLPGDARAISEVGIPLQFSDLQPGDLVFFNTLRRPYSHVGIYLGDHRFIHAPSTGGVVEIVNITQRYWQQRYDGARRLPI